MPGPYQHRDHVLCLCTECVARHRTKYQKEPNSDYPDCEDCFLQYNPLIGYVNEYCPEHPNPFKPPENKNSRKAEEGTQYAFTLTLPTGWNSLKPLEEVAKNIMEYGLTNKPEEKACKYAYVLEHTEKGTPHIHGVYQTKSGRRISSKYFQRYHLTQEFKKTDKDKHYWNENVHLGHGHRGGYHQKVRSNESYEGYLEKEGVVIKSNA